jgi:hypothetical protein
MAKSQMNGADRGVDLRGAIEANRLAAARAKELRAKRVDVPRELIAALLPQIERVRAQRIAETAQLEIEAQEVTVKELLMADLLRDIERERADVDEQSKRVAQIAGIEEQLVALLAEFAPAQAVPAGEPVPSVAAREVTDLVDDVLITEAPARVRTGYGLTGYRAKPLMPIFARGKLGAAADAAPAVVEAQVRDEAAV